MAFENFDPTHIGPYALDPTVVIGRSAVSLVGGVLVPNTSRAVKPLGIVGLDQEDIDNGYATKGGAAKVQYHAIARALSGGVITAGDNLVVGATGALESGALAGGWSVGTALTDAAAGEVFTILVDVRYVA